MHGKGIRFPRASRGKHIYLETLPEKKNIYLEMDGGSYKSRHYMVYSLYGSIVLSALNIYMDLIGRQNNWCTGPHILAKLIIYMDQIHHMDHWSIYIFNGSKAIDPFYHFEWSENHQKPFYGGFKLNVDVSVTVWHAYLCH